MSVLEEINTRLAWTIIKFFSASQIDHYPTQHLDISDIWYNTDSPWKQAEKVLIAPALHNEIKS